MKNKWFLFGLILLLHSSLFAQIQSVVGKSSYPFLLSEPMSDTIPGKKPLIIFLHGRSLSGTNLNQVKKYGILHEVEKGRKIPAYVVAPQVKMGESWSPDKLNELLDFLIQNYNVDSTRVYVAGMSLGGYGTLHFAGKFPHRIAAAAAFCGGGNTKDACNLATVPLWIIHGTADKAVPYSESAKIVKEIKGCKTENEVIFTTLEGGSHGAPERYFRMDSFYNWLFEHVNL